MMFKLCNNATKIKSCGDDGAPGCGAKQPTRYVKEGTLKIYADWKDATPEPVRKEFTAEDVLMIFQRIPENEMEVLGFNPKWNRPEWLISTVLPLPVFAVSRYTVSARMFSLFSIRSKFLAELSE